MTLTYSAKLPQYPSTSDPGCGKEMVRVFLCQCWLIFAPRPNADFGKWSTSFYPLYMYSPPYLFPVEAINLETFHNNDRLQSSNTAVTEILSIYKFELPVTGKKSINGYHTHFFLWSGSVISQDFVPA